MPGAAGQYEPGLVRLAESELADPPGVVAVVAHELAHHLLMGRGLLVHDLDAEWVTDLLPVCLGLGIFTGNATLRKKIERQGRHSSWSMRRRGYLNSCTIGYALALFAWVRGERRPDWARFLRPDAAQSLAAGLRYLDASQDSLLGPENVQFGRSPNRLARAAGADRGRFALGLRGRDVGIGPAAAR